MALIYNLIRYKGDGGGVERTLCFLYENSQREWFVNVEKNVVCGSSNPKESKRY